jgi:hypothetical protein
MAYQGADWQSKGFAQAPMMRVSSGDGLLLYRCWGERSLGVGSSEWGSGYFSREKPNSVLEAEMLFNIVDWDNGVHFVSSFRLKPGFTYWLGPVAHGASDSCLPGWQVFVEQPLSVKLELVTSREVLRHDVSIGPKNGNA